MSFGKLGARGGFGSLGHLGGAGVRFPPIPFGKSIVFAGHSLIANGFAVTSTQAQTLTQAYFIWMLMLAKQSLRLIAGSNAGVGGDTSAQLWARYATDVIAKAPGAVWINIGSNDLTTMLAGDVNTPGTSIYYMNQMLLANAAVGAVTFLLKVQPRGSVAVPMNSTELVAWNGINAWVATQNSAMVKVVDLEPAMGNMDAKHTMIAALSDDVPALHLNQIGSYVVAKYLNTLLASCFSAGSILDTVNAAPGNYITNGFFVGNGTGNVGSGTPPATGIVAPQWVGNGSSAGGAAVVYSKITRSDGFGEWQQVVASGTYTGSSKKPRVTAGIVGLSLNTGDLLQFVCEVQIDPNPTGVLAYCANVTTSAGDKLDVNFPATAMPPTTEGWSGVMQSLPFSLSANATTLSLDIGFILLTTATTDPVAGSMRIGRFAVRKLN